MVTRQDIGQRVLLKRRALGLTQQELAEKCGFPYQVISGLERGKQSIYAERLAVLAQALNSSADYLLGLSEETDAFWAVRAYLAEQEGYMGVEETLDALKALTASKDAEEC